MSDRHRIILAIKGDRKNVQNNSIAKMADVVIRVKNGKIRSIEEQENPMSADEVEW